MQRKWLLTSGTFVLTGGLFLLLQHHTNKMVLQAQVSPQGLAVGEPLYFADSTAGATNWRWQFGQSQADTSLHARGMYWYTVPGTHLIQLTVTDSVSHESIVHQFTVQVLPHPARLDSIVQLLVDTVGYEGQQLTFQTAGAPVHSYAWQFGETRKIDSRKPTAFYTYTKPGKYMVVLNTDATAKPLRQRIRILPHFTPFVKPVDHTAEKRADDIQWRLQRIANGSQVNQQYTYLLNQYFCGNANTLVVAGSLPPNDFYSYCMHLQFDPGWTIDAVEVEPDTATQCITKLMVAQHKGE